VLTATPPGDWRLDPVAYATAAIESRVLSSEDATVSERHLPDADLPERMATRSTDCRGIASERPLRKVRNEAGRVLHRTGWASACRTLARTAVNSGAGAISMAPELRR
jgi:hypothetical protein